MKEEDTLVMSENGVLRETFGFKRDVLIGAEVIK